MYWSFLGSSKQQESSEKIIYFCFIDYAEAFDCVDHNKLWKILEETGIPDQLTCLLRNLYAGQEATFRGGHGTTAWFQIAKGVCQGCILCPDSLNFYAEYNMRNTGLEEALAELKFAGRNINNLSYADDTTLMAESEEELKSLCMKVEEESEKVGLKLNIQKTISFSVVPFSSCLQSFSASGSFQISQLFTSGGQITGVSASTLVLPMNTQD